MNFLFCTDESVNYLLNYSKLMVDEISQNKASQNDFKSFQYLIFAGMISYYGFEHIDAIYKAFHNTEFINVSSDSNGVFDEAGRRTTADCQTVLSFRNGKYHIKNSIRYLLSISDVSQLLDCLIHEVNHVVNSVMSPICKRDSSLVYRMGVNIYALDDSFSESEILEETFNVLQTQEIKGHIRSFLNYSIYDSNIAATLDILRRAKVNWGEIGYESVVPDIKPLYLHRDFNCLLKENRLSGDIKEIRFAFDQKVGIGSFVDLSNHLEAIWNQRDYRQKAKVYELVSRYI